MGMYIPQDLPVVLQPERKSAKFCLQTKEVMVHIWKRFPCMPERRVIAHPSHDGTSIFHLQEPRPTLGGLLQRNYQRPARHRTGHQQLHVVFLSTHSDITVDIRDLTD